MARSTPYAGAPVPDFFDERTITADWWATSSKFDSVLAQQGGESSAALTTAEQAEVKAAQALALAALIEEPVHVGPNPPTNGEALWVKTDEDAPPTPVSVSSEDITDATDVGRAVLTAPLSADARNALAIYTGTRALLDAGTDTAERTWDAKELSEYVTSKAGSGVGVVVDARPWMVAPHSWLTATKLAFNGPSVTMTVSGRAEAATPIPGGAVIGTVPAQYRPLVEVFQLGQNVGGEGMRFMTNGDIASVSIGAGQYFRVSATWTR